MNNSLIVVLILFLICILGFIYNANSLKKIRERIQFVGEYREKFVIYVNKIFSDNSFDNDLYMYLTRNVNKIQTELGHDGVFDYVKDNLNNSTHVNYQMIINILPETRSSKMSFPIFRERVHENCQFCDDALIRHEGTIDAEEINIKKSFFNPLILFKDGISLILYIPVYLLTITNIISNENKNKIINNPIIRYLSLIVSFIVLLSAVVSLVAGWDIFIAVFN